MTGTLTLDDRLHDKYTCNGCSALLNIRHVNVADMTYHYFLFSSLQHSLPTPPPDCHQPLLAPTTSHLLTSSLGDEQTEEQPGRRFKHPPMCSEYAATEPQLLQNSTVHLCLLMNCLVYSLCCASQTDVARYHIRQDEKVLVLFIGL